ncbi:Response regulator receiver domain-containing protein [Catalinimonas alkaloidigena]|uniref:Response regulator receiver domain-containing protein n=1 Tax=Catalinimonas alkaloidigena TaxID=1075417 RepID=A0A1G8WS10_9BACT|nr:response regulator [Catalinimonas alkaloidigena]SDJ80991.1 Response regulator receiver domain-containing protein [Catalinimonas alkaloidigena]
MNISTSTFQSVLLIDDNSIDNFINKKLIETTGVAEQVVVMDSGAGALDYLKTLSTFPDVILLDVQMPGMDGFAFLQEYAKLPAELTQRCTVFMLSSSIDHRDLIRARENPHVKRYFNKPLNVQELLVYATA